MAETWTCRSIGMSAIFAAIETGIEPCSTRAMIAALFAQMPHGGDRKGDQKRKSALDLSVDEARA